MPHDASELPEEMTNGNQPLTSEPMESHIADSEVPRETTPPPEKKNPQLTKIRLKFESNKDHFSEKHLKWIESRLENNPTEDNLQKIE